jgi:hypothetical protein
LAPTPGVRYRHELATLLSMRPSAASVIQQCVGARADGGDRPAKSCSTSGTSIASAAPSSLRGADSGSGAQTWLAPASSPDRARNLGCRFDASEAWSGSRGRRRRGRRDGRTFVFAAAWPSVLICIELGDIAPIEWRVHLELDFDPGALDAIGAEVRRLSELALRL